MESTPRSRTLSVPPLADANPDAIEVLRVWAAPGSPQQIILRTAWRDAGAWGLLLVDLARHAAQAYAREGQDLNAALARIRLVFDAEWGQPTDAPENLAP
jgi:hypothetical protein